MNEIMTNNEVVEYLGLPQEIIENLKTQQGDEFRATANQFLSALINKICYQTVDTFGWENPFKKFYGFPINYGDTIENVFVELPRGYTFDKDAKDPFVKKVNDIKMLYASINYEMQYETTIQDTLLRRACLNEYGFMNLVSAILKSLTAGKNIDEYFADLSMLNNPNIYAGKQFKTLDVSTLTTKKEIAEALTQKIIDVTSSFELPSTMHNALGLMNATSKDNMILVIRRDLYNRINLDFLTGVFNLSKVDLIKKIIVVEDFRVKGSDGTVNGENLGFVVLDRRCFDCHVALDDSGTIYNPKGKYTNHYMNLWEVISFKYFYNAEAYKVVLPSETVEAPTEPTEPAGN